MSHSSEPADTLAAKAMSPDDFLQRVRDELGADDTISAQEKALADAHTEYVRELRQILPKDRAELVKSAAREARAKQPYGPGLRFHSLLEAKRQGIDLERLRATQRSSRSRLSDIIHGQRPFSPSEIAVRTLDFPFNWPELVEPLPAASATYHPPYANGIERRTISEASGDGVVVANQSYLDAHWGRLGTRMIGQNHNADDGDKLNLFHQAGIIVPFATANTAPLFVKADFTCLLCEHRISTSDEWGWSDMFAITRTGVKFEVFWERDDGEAMAEDFRHGFVQGLDASGDGESCPGIKVVVQPGESRSVNFLTDTAFPAGKTVWVYIGLSDFAWARLNDVSIDLSIDSAWQLTSLTVSAL